MLDETEITLNAPIPEDYLDGIANFDCIVDDLPATARQYDGDDEETLWTVSAYELDEDGEPAAQSSRWEHELWEYFRPDSEEER